MPNRSRPSKNPPIVRSPLSQDSTPSPPTKSQLRGAKWGSPDVTLAADFVCSVGASGSGKSHRLKARLAERLARAVDRIVVAFDTQGEYSAGLSIYTNEGAMWQQVNAGGLVRASLQVDAADPDKLARQFARVCAAMLSIGRSGVPCLLVVDELHLVTSNTRQPREWLTLIRTGRKFGVSVWAGTISSVDIDKNFWRNLAHLSCSRSNDINDQRRMANSLGVQLADVQQLQGHQFISRDMLTGQTTRE